MKVLGLFAAALIGFATGYLVALDTSAHHNTNTESIESKVIARTETKRTSGNWGLMDAYTFDNTHTYGTENMFTAIADLLPGESVHPAHRHAEEEFLVITRGTGEWSLEDRQFAANSGDLLYASPWKMHGLVNTGTDTMSFFIIKWQNKGIAAASEPEGDHGQ